MNRIIKFTVMAIFMSSSSAFSQTEPDTSWKKGGYFDLNFTQVNLSQWTQGGESSLSLTSSLNLFANYIKGKTDWSNNLDLSYALIKSGAQDIRKSDDKIEFTSKYGRKISDHWLFGALFNFKSQFATGYAYPNDSVVISNFLAPGYFTLGLGFTYKPVDYFEVFLSPATGKLTMVTDSKLSDAGAFGVDPGNISRVEFGAYLHAKFKKEVMTNITFTSKLELFNNYTDKDTDNARNIDVNWDSYLFLKVNKYITANLNVLVIYDADVIARTQLKNIIGVGLGYKF